MNIISGMGRRFLKNVNSQPVEWNWAFNLQVSDESIMAEKIEVNAFVAQLQESNLVNCFAIPFLFHYCVRTLGSYWKVPNTVSTVVENFAITGIIVMVNITDSGLLHFEIIEIYYSVQRENTNSSKEIPGQTEKSIETMEKHLSVQNSWQDIRISLSILNFASNYWR